jgi:hypothetical protein
MGAIIGEHNYYYFFIYPVINWVIIKILFTLHTITYTL